jgi:outer membrane immunogenic protein
MTMFRSLTLASAAALLGVAAPALAQPADAWTWTGPYVGVNAGYGGGDFKYPFSGTTDAAGTNPVAGRLRQSSSGPLGGGQAGYNVQGPGGLVFGVEADIDAANIRGRSSLYSTDSAGNFTSGGVESKIDYLGTVRGRVGAPMFDGRFLPYVTGGFAYGGVSNKVGFDCTTCATGGGFATDTQTQTGWTAGAGAEYALSRHLSFKVEYLYTDLGSRDLTAPGGVFNAPGVGLDNASVREKTDANIMRAGFNFRF